MLYVRGQDFNGDFDSDFDSDFESDFNSDFTRDFYSDLLRGQEPGSSLPVCQRGNPRSAK